GVVLPQARAGAADRGRRRLPQAPRRLAPAAGAHRVSEPAGSVAAAETKPEASAPELSVVVLSWNTRELLRRCLASLFQRDHGLRLEVIVVDNASHDGSANLVEREFPQARLLRNARNEGYARGNNQGIALAQAPLVLLLNSDTEVRGGALKVL